MKHIFITEKWVDKAIYVDYKIQASGHTRTGTDRFARPHFAASSSVYQSGCASASNFISALLTLAHA